MISHQDVAEQHGQKGAARMFVFAPNWYGYNGLPQFAYKVRYPQEILSQEIPRPVIGGTYLGHNGEVDEDPQENFVEVPNFNSTCLSDIFVDKEKIVVKAPLYWNNDETILPYFRLTGTGNTVMVTGGGQTEKPKYGLLIVKVNTIHNVTPPQDYYRAILYHRGVFRAAATKNSRLYYPLDMEYTALAGQDMYGNDLPEGMRLFVQWAFKIDLNGNNILVNPSDPSVDITASPSPFGIGMGCAYQHSWSFF